MWRELVTRLETALYPELQRLEPLERAAAKAHAAEEPFDVVEWLGIAFGIVAVTAMTRYRLPGTEILDRLAMMLVNFAIAIPLLGILIGPFLVRRTRRGLARGRNRKTR